MNCHFCNSELKNTALVKPLKEVFLLYECSACKPHEVLYRELYDDEDSSKLLADAIRIDEYLIIRNYQTNITEFDISTRDNNFTNVISLFKINGIWKIPFTDIEMVKQKLNLYVVFS